MRVPHVTYRRVHKRVRCALRADKAWASVYLRGMVQHQKPKPLDNIKHEPDTDIPTTNETKPE